MCPLPIDQPEVLEQVKCVKGDGRSYAGDLSRTVSGAPCQAWYSQVPNTHSIVPAHFQLELFGASFSCRNPGGLGERPWCYTALEGGPRWEYCDPPQCGELAHTHTRATQLYMYTCVLL